MKELFELLPLTENEKLTVSRDYAESMSDINTASRILQESIPNRDKKLTADAYYQLLDAVYTLGDFLEVRGVVIRD